MRIRALVTVLWTFGSSFLFLSGCGDATAPMRESIDDRLSVASMQQPPIVTSELTSTHTALISWTTTDPGTYWKVRRFTGVYGPNGPEWTTIAIINNSAARSFEDNGSGASKPGFDVKVDSQVYRVHPCNSIECTPPGVTILHGTRLAPPSNLRLTDETPDHVVIEWDDNSSTEWGFVITQRNFEGAFMSSVFVAANVTSRTYTTLTEGAHYTFVVQARVRPDKPQRHSDPSNTLTVIPGVGGTTSPSVTTGNITGIKQNAIFVVGTVNANGLAAESWFEWSLNSNMSGAQQTTHRSIGAGTVPIQDRDTLASAFAHGTMVYYRMVASNSAGTTYGAVRSVLFDQPGPPATVTSQLTNTHTAAIAWTAPTAPTAHFTSWKVRRFTGVYGPNGPEWTTIAIIGDSMARSFEDDGSGTSKPGFDVKADSQVYRVQACNGLECSSPNTTILHGTLLAPPTNLRLTDSTPNHIEISWDDNSSTEHGFVITQRNFEGAFMGSVFVGANVTSHVYTTLSEGVQYYFSVSARVKPNKPQRYSTPSNTLSVVP
jgi:hypothetical protein